MHPILRNANQINRTVFFLLQSNYHRTYQFRTVWKINFQFLFRIGCLMVHRKAFSQKVFRSKPIASDNLCVAFNQYNSRTGSNISNMFSALHSILVFVTQTHTHTPNSYLERFCNARIESMRKQFVEIIVRFVVIVWNKCLKMCAQFSMVNGVLLWRITFYKK